MGLLATSICRIDETRDVVAQVLKHFDSIQMLEDDVSALRAAADCAFSDRLLFEKFQSWIVEKEDDVLLFHVKRYLVKKNNIPFAVERRDFTSQREAVETKIKGEENETFKRVFSDRLRSLSLQYKLDTNAQLGNFLEVSEEQARKYRSGDHKPQLTTLRKIAEKFKVTVEYLAGINNSVD